MKSVIAVCVALFLFIVLIGADVEREATTPAVATETGKHEKPCYGYTIVEFGIGINCKGDTVKLKKVNGGQQLAASMN